MSQNKQPLVPLLVVLKVVYFETPCIYAEFGKLTNYGLEKPVEAIKCMHAEKIMTFHINKKMQFVRQKHKKYGRISFFATKCCRM